MNPVRRPAGMAPLLKKRCRAFTLLEVLLSMVIFALVSAMSFRGLQDTMSIQARLESKTEELSAEQVVWTVMFQDLINMARRPVQVGVDKRDIERAFEPKPEGYDCQFSFTRSGITPGISSFSGMQRVMYCAKDNRLYRQVWPVLDRPDDSSLVPHEALLLDKVLSFEMEWGGVEETLPDSAVRFDLEQLPSWIKIEMETENGLYTRFFPGADPYDPFQRKK